MTLFKGYVPTKNKKAIAKFKDTPLASLEEVSELPEYAGILAEDVILVDIDDHAQSEIMMHIVEDLQLDCRVYQTTRGRHFLFKNTVVKKCYTGTKLAIGMTADIKVGCKNSYSILKFKGEERFIEWDINPNTEYQELPKWLLPVKSNIDLMNLEDGDGRNQALFDYILTLTKYGLSKDEARATLQMVNKYIFKTPLSEDELETLSRDDAFPEDVFYIDGKFSHNAFAEYIARNNHICRINGVLHIYEDGVYINGLQPIERSMVKLIPSITARQRTEVLKYLELICNEAPTADARYIAFKNGIYDITQGTLGEFSPEVVITNQIPWKYVPNAYSELCDQTLNKIACNDSQIRSLLEECIGYCFYRKNELSKSFILTGEKANGKSTFLDMVKNLLGEGNVSSLDLSELYERFSVAELAGKLANIGDDISDEFLQGKSISIFKKIVSGNSIKAEFKGQDVFFFSPYAKLLFSANDIPRTRDKTGAVLRRLVIVPFNATFSKSDPDYNPYITWDLKEPEVMEYLIQIGISGLNRVLANNGFTESQSVQKAVEDYTVQNNPVLLFLQDKEPSEIANHSTTEIHKSYRVFCIENGFTEMTLINFSREICRRMSMETKRVMVDGKRFSVFTEISR